MPDKSTPPLTPPPPPAALPPPYRPPSHFPFPPESNFLALTRASSVATTDSPKVSHKIGHGLAETPPSSSKPPFSPVKTSRPEPRRAHSCSSSPLLFNPANGRPLTSPLDELNTLFSSGRSLLRKSTTGRKFRDSGEWGCVHVFGYMCSKVVVSNSSAICGTKSNCIHEWPSRSLKHFVYSWASVGPHQASQSEKAMLKVPQSDSTVFLLFAEIFCFTVESQSYRFIMSWGWVNSCISLICTKF